MAIDHSASRADYYDRRDARSHDKIVRHHQQALARLGYQVTLIPPGDAQTATSSGRLTRAQFTSGHRAGSAGAAARR